jgi:hypothetical protein
MIFNYVLIAKINEREKKLRRSRYKILNYNKSVQKIAILSRKSSVYNWDRVWLSELKILYYYENAESQIKYINRIINNV